MLDKKQKQLLDQLVAGLNDTQKAWLAGYMNGIAADSGGVANAAARPPLYIWYATETGNTKAIARDLEKQAQSRGFKPNVAALNKIKVTDLAKKDGAVILLMSTHGEGDPPEMGKKFFDAVNAAEGDYNGLKYTVLGLGDKAYAKFCGVAVTLDEKLAAGGATAFHPAALFDVDYESHVPAWIEQVFAALGDVVPAQASSVTAAKPVVDVSKLQGFSRLNPVTATVKDIVLLNDIGSLKETYHIELEFEENVPYVAGDSAGIILPQNIDDAKAPRLYSIASSPLVYGQEVHLTVALATHKLADGAVGHGVCSHYLASLKPGDKVQYFIQRNQRFRLPDDDAADIIMIGPGTGIAPLRAFVQERAEKSASGRNWLVFGDQHAHCDFLYQAEWQDYLESGSLTRLSAAFSRDQAKKIYVQDRLREHSDELLDWLDNGARIYICGAKSPMSEDVENTLLELIAARHGGPEKAQEYLEQMVDDDRYLKDVY